MALTDLISNVANKVGYKVTSNVISSNDTTTKQLLALLQSLNQDVMEQYNWPGLMRAGTITLVSGQLEYDVPADFSFHHYDTFWNQSERWPLYGALTNREYADLKGYGIESEAQDKFIIRGIVNKKIEISPEPDSSNAGQVVYFLYHSARYVKPVTWTESTTYAANDYCFYNNNYYYTTIGGTSGSTPPTHTSLAASDGGMNWAYSNNPYMTFVKDTDSTILPQRVIEQGLVEMFNDQKGLEYTPRFDFMVLEEYRRQKPAASVAASYTAHRFTFGANGRFYFGVAG